MLPQLRHSFRALLKTPGFTATALATLAICLGANLTIFAVVDAVLIRSLPYSNPEQLVSLYYTYPKIPSADNGASLTTYYERRGQIPALASIAAISQATTVIGEPGATSMEKLGRVTSEFFRTLGVEPFIGRAFNDSELTYQTDHVVMLSFEYWQTHFNSDPAALGKTIRTDGIQRVIVGVLPPKFRFLSFQAPVYMPLSSEDGERNVNARHNLQVIQIARLAPGATLADVQTQIAANDAFRAPEFPQAKIVAEAGCYTVVAPLHADHVAAVRPMLILLQAGALCLLIIGGVNLINLLLIRASSRSRELAIRQALGASQRHVVLEVMTETLLLCVGGAFLGLLVGAFGVDLLGALGANQLPLGAEITFNLWLGLMAVAASFIAGILLGLPIVWFNFRSRMAVALQSESRGSTVNRATQRLRNAFIVAQIALAFVLLAAAGLLGLSLKRTMAVSPGFRPDHIIAGQFTLTWFGYHTDGSFENFFSRFHEKTRSIPGVSSIGVVSTAPMVGGANENGPVTVPGYKPRPGEEVLIHNRFGVAGDYFKAIGIPLIEGRYLEQADAGRPERVCVIDENFANTYWPGENAIGKVVYRELGITKDNPPYTVVGVVGAVKQAGLTEAKPPGSIYFPFSQIFIRNYYLVARTSLAPESLGPTLTKIIREIDPDVPLNDLRTMESRIDDSLATRRSPALMAAIFALTALLLAAIGLYGVMAYTVSQRTSEFGIRMALGAQRSDVLRMVFGQGARLALIGLTLGVLGSLLMTSTLSSLLFNVQANDPTALAGVALILAAIAALACYLPARRATKVDPMVALRAE